MTRKKYNRPTTTEVLRAQAKRRDRIESLGLMIVYAIVLLMLTGAVLTADHYWNTTIKPAMPQMTQKVDA